MPDRSLEETNLRQFLFTSNEECRYVSGNPEYYKYYEPEKLSSIEKILKSDEPNNFLAIIKDVNAECALPRRENLLYALAVSLLCHDIKSTSLRHDIYQTVLQTIRSNEELFLFIKFLTKIKKTFPSGLNKVIEEYYSKKQPLVLAKDIIKCNGSHGWTHKDLIKLSHCKSQNILLKVVFTYVMFGIEKCREIAASNKNTKDLMDFFSKVEDLKKSNDANHVACFLHELQMPVTKIPTKFHKSHLVWSSVVNDMTVQEILRFLLKLYKLGLLKQDSPTHNKVVEVLSSADCVKKSKITPSQVFITMKNFEKGGKPKDPKLKSHLSSKPAEGRKVEDSPNETPKCPAVITALHKTLTLSYHNLKPLGKRYLIAMDATTHMNEKCLHNRNITSYEVAAFIIVSLLKSEKNQNVIVCCYTNQSVVQIPLEKGTSMGQLIKKFKEHEVDDRAYSSVINWALSKKKHIDVFYIINYFMGGKKAVKEKGKLSQMLHKYKTAMGLQTKLIRHSLSPGIPAPDENSEHSLQLCGFDTEMPSVVEGYIKNRF